MVHRHVEHKLHVAIVEVVDADTHSAHSAHGTPTGTHHRRHTLPHMWMRDAPYSLDAGIHTRPESLVHVENNVLGPAAREAPWVTDDTTQESATRHTQRHSSTAQAAPTHLVSGLLGGLISAGAGFVACITAALLGKGPKP
jgi:hypothetical protein